MGVENAIFELEKEREKIKKILMVIGLMVSLAAGVFADAFHQEFGKVDSVLFMPAGQEGNQYNQFRVTIFNDQTNVFAWYVFDIVTDNDKFIAQNYMSIALAAKAMDIKVVIGTRGDSHIFVMGLNYFNSSHSN